MAVSCNVFSKFAEYFSISQVASRIKHIKTTILSLLLMVTPSILSARDFVVVIDPGHGGKDIGAAGKITNEKTINLAVAKLLGDKIKDQFDDVKIIFTRDDDTFVSLKDRAAIANKASGDLFISIHVNSVDKRNRNRSKIQGASVYTLGLHKSADNLEVAKRENSVMALEDDYTTTYEGFNPDSAESYIIFELSQDMNMEQSVSFAQKIQAQLISTAGRDNRGVRQAGYWVLWATSMPAVLIELDFICNPEQEKYLASENGQQEMADAIFNAFSEYKNSSINRPLENSRESQSIENKDAIIYKVQILTSSKLLSSQSAELKGLQNVSYYIDNGLYKYTIGIHSDAADAEKHRHNIEHLFPAAFIIKTKNGQRIK